MATKDFIEYSPISGDKNATISVIANPNLSFQEKTTSVTVSGKGMTKSVGVSQFPNFPPVFGRYTSGSTVISSFINQTRFDINNGVFIIEFSSPSRTYTYSMGFAVINDEIITKSISSHLSIKFDGTLTSDIYKTPIKDSNFIVVGHVFPLEGISHTIEFLWDGILFFKYIVTYTA